MPDLILLDWHMPGMPTRETIAQIRRLNISPRPTVIYMTTEHHMEDIAEAKIFGDDYLLKPLDRITFEGKFIELALHGWAAMAARAQALHGLFSTLKREFHCVVGAKGGARSQHACGPAA